MNTVSSPCNPRLKQNLVSLLEEKAAAAAAADGALMAMGGMPMAVAEAISFK
jgi:hypothetical protein